eukprot:2254657-Rhodomonas_salina.3
MLLFVSKPAHGPASAGLSNETESVSYSSLSSSSSCWTSAISISDDEEGTSLSSCPLLQQQEEAKDERNQHVCRKLQGFSTLHKAPHRRKIHPWTISAAAPTNGLPTGPRRLLRLSRIVHPCDHHQSNVGQASAFSLTHNMQNRSKKNPVFACEGVI